METVRELKEELARTIRAYHAKGWSPATSTNYSFRVDTDPETIYVSRSGVDKSQFTADDFIEVDTDGKLKPGFEECRPSAETLIHVVLYSLFPETHCILHSHSVYSVLHSAVCESDVTFEGYEILKGYDGIATHETEIKLPVFENTQDIAVFSQLLEQYHERLTIPAFIMRKHGTYAWGKNLFEAKRHLETTEYLLEVEWRLRKM